MTAQKPSKIAEIILPAAFALAAGLGWSLFDAFQLSGADHSPWRAWAMAASAACLVALVVTPMALALRWAWQRPSWGGKLREWAIQKPAQAATAAILGIVALGAMAVGTYLIQATVRLSFGSEMVRTIAVAATVPALGAAIGAAVWLSAPALRRRLEAVSSPRALAAMTGGFVAIGLILAALSVPLVAPTVWEELALPRYLAVPIIGTAAVAAIFIPPRRAVLGAAGLTALVTLGLAVFHIATPTPDHLRRALAVQSTGTGFVFELVPERPTQRSSATRVADGGATCFPDVEPLAADAIGEVDEDAPDIIFITADALRWDHTTMSGYEHPTTEHIAEHAEEAAVFEQGYSPASNTRQAFRGFFTGIYPSLVEAPSTPGKPWATSFVDDQETMAGYLNAAGYQTIALSSRDRAFPEEHGALNGFEVIDETPIPLELDTGHSVSYKVDRIISHLSELDDDRPRFIWTHLMEIHQPYPAGPNPRPFDTGPYSRYNSAIHFVDGEMKRLLDFARGVTRADNTIVVLTADHGQAFGEHDNRLHGMTVYQEEIHVPLIFWGPDVEPRWFDEPAVGVDILPTLLGWLDLEVPEAMCGDDLSGAIVDGEDPPNTPVYVENIPDDTRDYFGVAFIEDTEKLLLFPSKGVAELYDLAEDPGELNDLSKSDPERFRQRLNALQSYYEKRGMDPDFYHLDALME